MYLLKKVILAAALAVAVLSAGSLRQETSVEATEVANLPVPSLVHVQLCMRMKSKPLRIGCMIARWGYRGTIELLIAYGFDAAAAELERLGVKAAEEYRRYFENQQKSDQVALPQ